MSVVFSAAQHIFCLDSCFKLIYLHNELSNLTVEPHSVIKNLLLTITI